jgi:ABC-type bacteriocin/lantibiotic exporter with double-glycine peptidase domain
VLIIGVFIFGVVLVIKIFANIAWYLSLDNFGGKYIKSLCTSGEYALGNTYMEEVDKLKPNLIKHTMYYDLLDVFRVIAHHIPTFIGSFLIVVVSVVLAVCYNLQITIFIVVALTIGLLMSYSSRIIVSKTASKTNAKLKKVYSTISNFVDAISFVQTNNVISYFQQNTENSIDDFINTAKKEDKIIYFWSGTVQSYNTLFTIALSALLAIPSSGSSLINLVFFTALSTIIMKEGQNIELVFHQIFKSKISFENLDKIMNLPQKLGRKKIDNIQSIDLRNVYFSYPNSQNYILNNFDCNMNIGDCVKLSGPNGSGKSTLVKIITGQYKVSSGEVNINGESILDYQREDLNEQILYINQDELILNETISDYLKIITGSKTQFDDIKDHLTKLNIESIDRPIENNGLSLSVGQRKKILFLKMISRLQNASVVIIDETNAGLDSSTQKIYYDFVNEMIKNKDKIIVVIDHSSEDAIFYTKNIEFSE